MKAFLTAALAIACAYSFSLKAQETSHEQIDRKVREYAEKERGGGVAVAIIYPDPSGKGYKRDVFFYGHTKGEASPAPQADTIFYLGSVTKVFVATVLAKFIKEGKINLDDPAQKYVPSWVHVPTYEGKQITIRNLATHSSSLPRDPPNLKHPGHYEVKDFYEFLNHYKLKEAPGTKYLYSNAGFGFLGVILSNIAHTGFQELIVKEMCVPLKMPDTRIYYSSSQQEKRIPYFYSNGKRVFNSSSPLLPGLGGGGSFSSTLNDMSQFLSFNLGILNTDMNDILPILHQDAYTIHRGEYMCLGWHDAALYPGSSLRALVKNGGLPGVSTFIGFVPKSTTGVVVLANDKVSTTPLGMAILKILNPRD